MATLRLAVAFVPRLLAGFPRRHCPIAQPEVGVGVLLDLLKGVFNESGDYYYRFVPLWSMIFSVGAAIFAHLVYREWRALGGAASYVPPRDGATGEIPVES